MVGSFRDRQNEIWRAEDAVLLEVQQTPIPTDSLISIVKSQNRLNDYSVRAAIWALVGRGDLVLRSERGAVFVARPA